jgi:DNA-binding CsgD family transcriptional regulator
MKALDDMSEVDIVLLEKKPDDEEAAEVWWINYLEYLGADLVNEYRHSFGVTIEKANGWDVPEEAKEMMGEVSDSKIAEKFNVHSNTVRKHRKRLGIDSKELKIKLPDDCIKQLGEKSDAKLAKEYGVNPGVIKYRREQRGIKSKHSSLTKQEAGEVKWLAKNTNMTQQEIGKKYGKTGGCVRNIVDGRSHSDADALKPSQNL